MSLARVVCRHRRLLMQFDPQTSSRTLSSTPSLAQRLHPKKRSFLESQPSTSLRTYSSEEDSTPRAKQARIDSPPSTARHGQSHSRRLHTAVQTVQRSRNTNSEPPFAPEFVMPSSKNTPSSRSRQQPSASSNQPRNIHGKMQPKTQPVVVTAGRLQEPVRDLAFIQSTFNPQKDVLLKPQWIDNPKAPLTNYVQQKTGKVPVYYITQGTLSAKKYFRYAHFYFAPRSSLSVIQDVMSLPTKRSGSSVRVMVSHERTQNSSLRSPLSTNYPPKAWYAS
jgi:hypothetical protein